MSTGQFEFDRKMLQRLIYFDLSAEFSIPIDLIPFRGAVSDDNTIKWPPSRDIVMNIAGFEEALASSISIQLEDNLRVRVASLPGLTILKLIAWSDRSRETNKDAADLYRLLTTYADAGNTDRVYEHEMDLLEAVGFDMELAGAQLLGRDVVRLCTPIILAQIRSLLGSQSDLERLVRQMVQTSTHSEATPAVERIIDSFCGGIRSDG